MEKSKADERHNKFSLELKKQKRDDKKELIKMGGGTFLPKLAIEGSRLLANVFENMDLDSNTYDYEQTYFDKHQFSQIVVSAYGLKFVWFKSKDKVNWNEVGKGFTYTPNNSDINYYLKISCTPKNSTSEGPTQEATCMSIVEAGPCIYPFETRHLSTQHQLKGKKFRVVSYNILSDQYCKIKAFPYCPPHALNIDYRKHLICKEISGFNADIMCLQEVDRKVFRQDLKPLMKNLGCNGKFSIKKGTAEGLAVFIKLNRFECLESGDIVLSKLLEQCEYSDIWEIVKQNKLLSKRILERPTVMQVTVIKSLENHEVLVVANTHFYFHPDADHIRLIHGGLAMRYLEKLVKRLKIEVQQRVSVIFCGDFNSFPTNGVFKLFTTGEVPSNYVDFQSNVSEAVNSLSLEQPFKMDSACGTPKYTNFTESFANCLDYIFYEKTNLSVIQVVPFPGDEVLKENTALPSVTFPSDHISLIADLQWTNS